MMQMVALASPPTPFSCFSAWLVSLLPECLMQYPVCCCVTSRDSTGVTTVGTKSWDEDQQHPTPTFWKQQPLRWWGPIVLTSTGTRQKYLREKRSFTHSKQPDPLHREPGADGLLGAQDSGTSKWHGSLAPHCKLCPQLLCQIAFKFYKLTERWARHFKGRFCHEMEGLCIEVSVF